jgi:putative transposase
LNLRRGVHVSSLRAIITGSMHLTYKYALRPTKAQAVFLDSQLRAAAELYNAAVQERIGAWRLSRKSIGLYDQTYQLKDIRAAGDTALVNATCAHDVLLRVDRAFQAFYRRVKRGAKRIGFPRYRSARRYDSLTFEKYGNGCRLLPNRRLRVQGTDPIRVIVHRPLKGTVKRVTITREAGRWFVCFCITVDPEPLPVSTEAIGIDLGLVSFATLSDGAQIENPRHYQAAHARLRRAERKVARRKRGSHRRQKAVQLLGRAHAHVRNQRADFHHKTARELVNSYGTIAIEDLNLIGLASGMLAKSVRDAGWSSFIEKLTYKAADAGRVLVKVDPSGTSQTCLCGAAVPKILDDRWHKCPACGLSLPRDHVSAQLILHLARNSPSGANVADRAACVA